MPVILGPTACGKTAVAARLAYEIGGEVISADSRQVYRGMDIGSGKDLDDYVVEGTHVPYHLIDIAEPGSEYNIFEYQKDFSRVYHDIAERGKIPILCGGSGMYLESVLKGYSLPETPPDPQFAASMESTTDAELLRELSGMKKLHSTTDITDRERMIRAIEIERKRMQDAGYGMQDEFRISNIECRISNPQPATNNQQPATNNQSPTTNHQFILFGINPGREIVRQRITARLRARLKDGMVDEVRALLLKGIPPERLKAYGLEYKFITLYIEGELTFEEMSRLLNTAIHQFAKRQMTWFRRMEKQGMLIHWIEGEMTLEEKVRELRNMLPRDT